jgi:hypothetical protein
VATSLTSKTWQTSIIDCCSVVVLNLVRENQKGQFLREILNNLTTMSFSPSSVWKQSTESGFRQQVFIMFHSTRNATTASSILHNGFESSTGQNQMLGNGIYVSTSLEKCEAYGDITFKLLVYPGDVCKVDYQGHPWQRNWHCHWGSAWVPPNCGMVDSGQEVSCH